MSPSLPLRRPLSVSNLLWSRWRLFSSTPSVEAVVEVGQTSGLGRPLFLRLKKAEGTERFDNRVRRKVPWIFSNEVENMEELREAATGPSPISLVSVLDSEGKERGTAIFNGFALISARMLSENAALADADLDQVQNHLTNSLRDAVSARRIPVRFLDRPSLRLVNSEADKMPGVFLDKIERKGAEPGSHTIVCLSLTSALMDRWLPLLLKAIRGALGKKTQVMVTPGPYAYERTLEKLCVIPPFFGEGGEKETSRIQGHIEAAYLKGPRREHGVNLDLRNPDCRLLLHLRELISWLDCSILRSPAGKHGNRQISCLSLYANVGVFPSILSEGVDDGEQQTEGAKWTCVEESEQLIDLGKLNAGKAAWIHAEPERWMLAEEAKEKRTLFDMVVVTPPPHAILSLSVRSADSVLKKLTSTLSSALGCLNEEGIFVFAMPLRRETYKRMWRAIHDALDEREMTASILWESRGSADCPIHLSIPYSEASRSLVLKVEKISSKSDLFSIDSQIARKVTATRGAGSE